MGLLRDQRPKPDKVPPAPDTIARQVLLEFGVDLEKTRAELRKLLGGKSAVDDNAGDVTERYRHLAERVLDLASWPLLELELLSTEILNPNRVHLETILVLVLNVIRESKELGGVVTINDLVGVVDQLRQDVRFQELWAAHQ